MNELKFTANTETMFDNIRYYLITKKIGREKIEDIIEDLEKQIKEGKYNIEIYMPEIDFYFTADMEECIKFD